MFGGGAPGEIQKRETAVGEENRRGNRSGIQFFCGKRHTAFCGRNGIGHTGGIGSIGIFALPCSQGAGGNGQYQHQRQRKHPAALAVEPGDLGDSTADGVLAAEGRADVQPIPGGQQAFPIEGLGIVLPGNQTGLQNPLVTGPFAVEKRLTEAQPYHGIEPVEAPEQPIQRHDPQIMGGNMLGLVDQNRRGIRTGDLQWQDDGGMDQPAGHALTAPFQADGSGEGQTGPQGLPDCQRFSIGAVRQL